MGWGGGGGGALILFRQYAIQKIKLRNTQSLKISLKSSAESLISQVRVSPEP